MSDACGSCGLLDVLHRNDTNGWVECKVVPLGVRRAGERIAELETALAATRLERDEARTMFAVVERREVQRDRALAQLAEAQKELAEAEKFGAAMDRLAQENWATVQRREAQLADWKAVALEVSEHLGHYAVFRVADDGSPCWCRSGVPGIHVAACIEKRTLFSRIEELKG